MRNTNGNHKNVTQKIYNNKSFKKMVVNFFKSADKTHTKNTISASGAAEPVLQLLITAPAFRNNIGPTGLAPQYWFCYEPIREIIVARAWFGSRLMYFT